MEQALAPFLYLHSGKVLSTDVSPLIWGDEVRARCLYSIASGLYCGWGSLLKYKNWGDEQEPLSAWGQALHRQGLLEVRFYYVLVGDLRLGGFAVFGCLPYAWEARASAGSYADKPLPGPGVGQSQFTF